MEQPQLLKDELHPNYVCKLHKPLYGLKQSLGQWYWKLHRFLLTNSFVQLQSEPTLYVQKKYQKFLFLVVYVDYLPNDGTSKANILQFVNNLQQVFPTKHLGELEYFLELEVNRNRSRRTLFVSQCKLVDNILHKYDMMACSLVDTPLIVPCHLSTSESPSTNEEVSFMQNIPYHHILGSLR